MVKLLLKVFFLVLVLVIALLFGVGYLASDQVDSREQVTIDAPVGQVFALVVNPTRVPEWLPKSEADIAKVEVFKIGLAKRGIGAIVEAFGLGKAQSKDPTHRYVLAGGTDRYLDMQITALELNRRYMEKVVGGTGALLDLFKTIEWGYEMRADPADPAKTQMTVIWRGVAARPLGVFMSKANSFAGQSAKGAEEMAKNITRILKKGRQGSAPPTGPASPKAPQ